MCEHLDAIFANELQRVGSGREIEADAPKKWAVAGRSKQKLKKLARNCKTSPEIIEVNSDTEMDLMAEMSSVVLNAAGPYFSTGSPVVAACVKKKTHYVDITGELVWMKRMITAHHEA